MLNVLSVLCCIGKGSMRTVLHHVSKKTLFFYGKSDEKERRRFSVSKRLWKKMTIKERREFEHVFFTYISAQCFTIYFSQVITRLPAQFLSGRMLSTWQTHAEGKSVKRFGKAQWILVVNEGGVTETSLKFCK